MNHRMGYKWVIYESQDGLQIAHRWVSHTSHMSQRWIAYGWQDKLQTGQKWILYESWLRNRWVIHSHIWVKHCYVLVSDESWNELMDVGSPKFEFYLNQSQLEWWLHLHEHWMIFVVQQFNCSVIVTELNERTSLKHVPTPIRHYSWPTFLIQHIQTSWHT